MNTKVAIIDYQMGNLFSVSRMCEYVRLMPIITSNISEIMTADAVILPGVGAFGDAMDNLRRLDLINPIKDFIYLGKPFMGICLGMQLLFSRSEEFGVHNGLDIIKGNVIRFPLKGEMGSKIKVPHIGWNKIYRPSFTQDDYWEATPLQGLANDRYMYFVHSFYPVPDDSSAELSMTTYEDVEFCSSVHFNNIFAFQFHPEKSCLDGLAVYKNFNLLIKKGGVA